MTAAQFHLIIIGGGITGLAAAYYAQQRAGVEKLPLSYTLIEGGPRLGGKVVSERGDGFVIEGGPDSFLTQKPWALALCHDLGLAERLIGTNDAQRQVYILRHGRLCPLPQGMRLIVPTKLGPFLRSPLLSPWGKLRAGLDWFIPPRAGEQDESIAAFVGRRMGREMVETLAGPIMAGIHVGDPARLSIQSTFPRYPELEKAHGSLIKGTLAQMKKAAAQPGGRPKLPMFMSLKGGLSELIEALVKRLRGNLLTGQTVTALRVAATGAKPYRLRLSNGDLQRADAVILATPAYVSAELLQPLQPQLAAKLNQLRYLSSATISLAYRRQDVAHPLDGFGFIVPKMEPCPLLACTWVSTKFDHRAPADQVLLRAFVGGAGQEELIDLSDGALLALVREALAPILGLRAEPTRQRLYRWRRANPQYDVGHLARIAEIEALAAESLPGLYLSGSAFRGVGLPDCIRQGREAAEAALSYLTARRAPQTPLLSRTV